MSHGLHLVLVCVFLPAPGFGQPGATLSVANVETVLKGKVGLSCIAAVVNGCGANFAANAAAIKRRYVTTVDGTVMLAVGKGADEYVSRKPGEQENTPEPVKPKPPEAMKAAEPKVGPRLGAASPPQRSDDGAQMVSVPAGAFWMGSEESEAYAAEKPRRRVYLDAFQIDKYEVTNTLYRRFIDARAYRTPSYWNDSNWNQPNQPVVGVSWDDANAYCIWAGKRLATEAEWEKAARGTDGRKYPWGEQWDANRTNSGESKLGKTVPVGSYSGGVSPYGAHDMASNVWEWVADWYDANYYLSAPSRNPRDRTPVSCVFVAAGPGTTSRGICARRLEAATGPTSLAAASVSVVPAGKLRFGVPSRALANSHCRELRTPRQVISSASIPVAL